MALGWNEIKERAARFSKEWENACNEEAEAKQFLIEFFNVFGIGNRKVSTFEHRVKKLGDKGGYIDLLWKGIILIEMKSRGKDLDKAYQQAKDYTHGLKQHELPRYILISDFGNLRLYDLDENTESHFLLKDFVKNVHLFGFIAGYQKRVYKEEDPVNIEAAYLMGKLHDAIKDAGYTGHEPEKYLVRLLFCLFAEDTDIFDKQDFQYYIQQNTKEDGSDLGMHLAQLFQVLNTHENKRQKTLDESLTIFPYVNGQLFDEQLSFASFNSKMRQSLLECCYLDWSRISPAIFGSMFQSVMEPNQRRNLGAHYTSEKNILKLIKPLFLDKLWKEFETVKHNHNKLLDFQKRIANLRFLDPACGCGNFLVISYRELRLLEIEVIKYRLFYHMKMRKEVAAEADINISQIVLCDIDRFYGIEYEEFPSQIAQVAMWLIDHQMNMIVTSEFGKYFKRIPLKKTASIIHGNALRTNWDRLLNSEKSITIYANKLNYIEKAVVADEQTEHYKTANVITQEVNKVEQFTSDPVEAGIKFDYILGNPPFIGKNFQGKEQKADLSEIFNGVNGAGNIDYVTAWYIKAAKYLEKNNTPENIGDGIATRVAFVSTNSITQGEQVGILWNELFNRYKINIHFAHRTFKWGNEAKANAAVHVVIIGFSNFDISEKFIYVYDDIKGEPHELKVKNINPYLVEGSNNVLIPKSHPICNVQEMLNGNKVVDGGNLILDTTEKDELLRKEPLSEKYIRMFIGSDEYINNTPRWCLWLKNAAPEDLRKMPLVLDRIRKVKEMREQSVDKNTQKWASFPTLFMAERQPETDYLLIPRVSSENRIYVPIGFLSKEVIISDRATSLPNATLYTFGVITSLMHMAWMKYTCGRMKSDYNYSNSIVYNNFPWPENSTDKQKQAIEKAAQKVLDTRIEFPNSSLADLYNPLSMPPVLVKAHQELDRAVDLAYRPQAFINEAKRIEFLFELYDRYTSGLFAKEKNKKKK
jgi:hypothetical protein